MCNACEYYVHLIVRSRLSIQMSCVLRAAVFGAFAISRAALLVRPAGVDVGEGDQGTHPPFDGSAA